MSVFVLVHGAFHGRWCFRRLTAALEERGHKSVAIDLPGHGDSEIDPSTVTMADYVESVCRAVESVEHDRPVLVGHSMGGMVVSAAAERLADRVAGVSYIAAYLPKSGESLMAIEARNPAPRMPAVVAPTPDLRLVNINAEAASPIFYSDCSELDAFASASRLGPQPGEPFLTPVMLSEEIFGAVSKHYVVCGQDLTIPTPLQQEMTVAWQDVDVTHVDAGHSPFLSKANELADSLCEFATGLATKRRRAAA